MAYETVELILTIFTINAAIVAIYRKAQRSDQALRAAERIPCAQYFIDAQAKWDQKDTHSLLAMRITEEYLKTNPNEIDHKLIVTLQKAQLAIAAGRTDRPALTKALKALTASN